MRIDGRVPRRPPRLATAPILPLLALGLGMVVPAGEIRAQHPAGIQQLQRFPPEGGLVAPFFDGWYQNPDGSFTLSFGYMNRNTQEVVEIPLGPNNRIEPAEYDGMQPTVFYPVSYGGYSGRRERGVFSVTIPADERDIDVVWTLSHNGYTYSVPGRVGHTAYELSHAPMGVGSLPPALGFENGPSGAGRQNIIAPRMTISVGQPLGIDFWVQDRGEREQKFPVEVVLIKHQGPGPIAFEPATQRLGPEAGGGPSRGSAMALFTEPGEYMIRVRVDNFDARDSRFSFQCCWTNGYVPVTVVP